MNIQGEIKESLLEKLKRALQLAKGIIDYCGADAWEMECTANERAEFQTIYDEVFPPLQEPLYDPKHEFYCDTCKISMPKGNAESHLHGKRHKSAVALLLPHEGSIIKKPNFFKPILKIVKYKKVLKG